MAAPRPVKGILKNKNSVSSVKSGPELQQVQPQDSLDRFDPEILEDDQQKKSQKWDEMNILATFHPADKDYGLMKIDEPSTPYNRVMGDEDDEGSLSESESNHALTADDLARKLTEAEREGPRVMRELEEEEEESSEEEEELSPEEQAKKKHFHMMRKKHYNEGLNIKMARELIANEVEGEDEDEEMKEEPETEDISVDRSQDGDSLDL